MRRFLLVVAGIATIPLISGCLSMSPKPRIAEMMVEAELEHWADDVTELLGPGMDVEQPNLDVEPKSRIGVRFKEFLEERTRLTKEFDRRIEGVDLGAMLSAKRMGTAKGRDESEMEIDRWKTALETYVAEEARNREAFVGWIQQEFGVKFIRQHELWEQEAELKRLLDEAPQATVDLISFVRRAQPKYDPRSDMVLFETNAQVKRFGQLTKRVSAGWDEVVKTDAALSAARTKYLSRQLSILRGFE